MTQAPAPVCLLTRPAAQAARFAARVEAELSLPSLISPLLRIAPVQASIDWTTCAGAILTSQHAASRLAALGAPRALPVYAVGTRTAEIASEHGFAAEALGGDVEAFLPALLARLAGAVAPGALLHLRGVQSRGDLAARLTESGVPCEEAVVYQQLEEALTAEASAYLAGGEPVIAPVFSPRSGQLLARAAPFRAPVHVVAMSANVAASFDGVALAGLCVADLPTEEAMIAAMARISR
ncbi:MAG: uroporphyrinogen-III synthase [Pseudomonadota bacterium]